MFPGWPHPAPGPLILGQARLRKPGEGLPGTFSHFFFLKKTDENELTAKKKNQHKSIKNSDDRWTNSPGMGEGMRRGQGQGASSLPAVRQCPTLPSEKGHPPTEPKGLARGGRHKSTGIGGTSTPLRSPGGQEKKGIIKAKKLQN